MTGESSDRTGPGQPRRPAGGSVAFGSFAPATITDARSGASQELATRQRRYAITMAFRTACFIAMVFVPGVFRWVLFGCAVFLPYIAVLLANQAHQRDTGTPVGGAVPGDAPAITTGPAPAEIITGDVEEDPQPRERDRDDRVA